MSKISFPDFMEIVKENLPKNLRPMDLELKVSGVYRLMREDCNRDEALRYVQVYSLGILEGTNIGLLEGERQVMGYFKRPSVFDRRGTKYEKMTDEEWEEEVWRRSMAISIL